jgi:hypothetical protein
MANDQQTSPGKESVNLKEWQAASDILNRAIELVNEKDWQQGEVLPVSRVCLSTAIERAWQEKKYSLVDFNYTRDALSKILQVPRDPEALPSDPLDVPYWGRHFMEWNDVPGRTKDEVIDTLKAALALSKEFAEKSKT